MKAGLTQHGGDKGTYALALRLLCLGLVCAASLGATAATTVATGTHGFTPAELQQVLSLGPWPPPVQRDPSNRVSGQPLAITLGRQLFRDPRMSPVGYIACVTCHQPGENMAVSAAGLTTIGEPMLARHNGPYVLSFLRRNEV